MTQDLQTEVEKLRAQVESYRQREFDSMRDRLVAALEDVAAWKAEAQRISAAAYELNSVKDAEIAELRSRLAAAQPRGGNWTAANERLKQAQAAGKN